MTTKKYYIDLIAGDIKFNDLADLFFAAVFCYILWLGWGWQGVAFLTFVFLIRLKEVPKKKCM